MFYGQNADFLKEEIRCDWKIDEKTKKVWAVQLDLVQLFLKICKEHNLRCFAIFGTLLGAIRHKGYIPWDDDIDMGMPRKDYDTFLELCKNGILEEPYFLQTTVSDVDSYEIHSSLRNSNTTGNCDFNMSKRCNNGIAIDIVPIDGIPSDFKAFRKYRRKIRFKSSLCNTFVNTVNKTWKAKLLRFFMRIFTPHFDYKKQYLKNEQKLREIDYDTSVKVSTVLIADSTPEGLFWDKADFDKVLMVPFENIEIPIPAGYDNNLRINYGNYLEFPPLEQRGDKHHIDYHPEIPYKEYCSKNYGVKY